MLSLKALNVLSSREKQLMYGYFAIYCPDKYIPPEIIKLSILYCYILDEFDTNLTNKNIKISGINNTIISTKMRINSDGLFAVGRNVLINTGQYHWRFRILNNSMEDAIYFGFAEISQNSNKVLNDNNCLNLRNHDILNKNDIIDIYYDSYTNTTNYIINYLGNSNLVEVKNNKTLLNTNTRMFIVFYESCSVELIEYHNSNWYGLTDAYSAAECSKCFHFNNNDAIKLKYILRGLNKYPMYESWNNEYILYLLRNDQITSANQHIIKYKKGYNGICQLAFHYYNNDKDYTALELFKMVDDQAIDRNNMNFRFAYCLNRNNEHKKALKYYQKALKYLNIDIKPGSNRERMYQQTLLNIAYIYEDMKDYDNAVNIYLKLGDSILNKKHLLYHIGYLYEQTKDIKQAMKYYNAHIDKYQQISNSSKTIDDYLHLVTVYTSETMLKDFNKANEIFCNALKLDVNNYNVNKRYGRFLFNNDKFEESLIYFEKTIKFCNNQHDQTTNYSFYAHSYYNIGNINSAIEMTICGLKYDSKDSDLLNNLGYYYLKRNDPLLAEKYLRLSLNIDPNHAWTNGNLANLLFHSKRYNESIMYFEKSLNMESDLKHKEVGPICLKNYTNLLIKNNNLNKLINIYEKLMKRNDFKELFQNYDELYYLMSTTMLKLLRKDEAKLYILKALKNKPNNLIYQQQLHHLQK